MPREDYGVLPTVDEDGMLVGVLDTGAIELRAQRLVFEIAALCLDRNAVRLRLGERVGEMSPEEGPLILAAALRMAIEDVLSPAVELLKSTGTDLTVAYAAIRDGLNEPQD